MTHKLLFAVGVLLSLDCALFGYLFLKAAVNKEYKKAFWLKGIAGLFFVLLGVLNFALCADKNFAIPVLWGLVFGLLGDQLLAMRFINRDRHDMFFVSGAAAFAVGHGLYIAALFGQDRGAIRLALPIFAVGLLASALYARFKKTNAGKLQSGVIAYIAIVVFMTAVACSAAARHFSAGLLLFAAGGISFSVSDNLLCAYSFGNDKRVSMNRAVHVSYYAAQLLIAWSIRFL